MNSEEMITVQTTIDAPINKIWDYWTQPDHITKWNFAIDEWHSPRAQNDLREGGVFNYRMEAKDGTMGFDFQGEYVLIDQHRQITYTLGDGRKVQVTFEDRGNSVVVTENFEPENTFSKEMQQQGWQNILNNFKKYVEEN